MTKRADCHRRTQRGAEPSGRRDPCQLRSALGDHSAYPACGPCGSHRAEGREILCYSFLPADGVERLIQLRSRVRQRLKENAEVVGTDEAFFEDEGEHDELVDLYNEKSGILDGEV